MNKIRLHIFAIFKLLFMLVFLESFLILKIQVDAYNSVGAYALLYNFRTMIESIVYSVIIIFVGSIVMSRLV